MQNHKSKFKKSDFPAENPHTCRERKPIARTATLSDIGPL